MGEWRLEVDQTMCVGSATCTAIAPTHFELDEEDRSRPVNAAAAPDKAVRDAAAMCPTGAVHVVDADTGEPVQ